MRRSDHDTCGGVHAGDRPGEHGRRLHAGMQHRPDTHRSEHPARVLGEQVALAASVVGDRRRHGVLRRGCRRMRRASSNHRPRPAAAWRTTSRFMRIDPAATAARRPAVPNCNRPSNRAASSAASPDRAAAISDESSSRMSASGSASSHAVAVRIRSSGARGGLGVSHQRSGYAARPADEARHGRSPRPPRSRRSAHMSRGHDPTSTRAGIRRRTGRRRRWCR